MKKLITILGIFLISAGFVFAQDDGDFYIHHDSSIFESSTSSEEDELFGGSSISEDDLFGGSDSEDDLFSDDGIEEIDTTAKSDSSKGILFEAGSVKVGGRLRAGLDANTTFYDPDQTDIVENLKNTGLTPTLSAFLSVDARPSQNLRMYTKFGFGYPFGSQIMLNLTPSDMAALKELTGSLQKLGPILAGLDKNTTVGDIAGILGGLINNNQNGAGGNPPKNNPNENKTSFDIKDFQNKLSIKDWFTMKELFTDFSIKDTAFFRFGLHTVSWGTGYFFSPVSDMINTSSIDPENPTEQVNGALNLRTQIVFPGTQNCLWAYVIPSTNFKAGSASAYARDTGLAAKYEFVLGGWEIGTGAFWKYESAPKLMATASGSIKKLSLFGECVYQYGGAAEWAKNKDWSDKTNIFQITAGGFYTWKDPGIMLGMQYYYDGNNVDLANRLYTDGHNIALVANFNKFGDIDNLSASVFGIVNFGRTGFNDAEKATLEEAYGSSNSDKGGANTESEGGFEAKSPFPSLMVNAMVSYRPFNSFALTIGPELIFSDFETKPTVSLKIGATLGGGKF